MRFSVKSLLCIILLCCIILCSCGTKVNQEYKTDVKVDDICQNFYQTVNNTSLSKADDGWVALNIPIDTSSCSEYSIYISLKGESDIFGVFKTNTEEDAQELFMQAEDYLTKMEENWMSEYSPEELPKVQNAKAIKCGLYVSFLILEDSIRDTVENNFKDMLEI